MATESRTCPRCNGCKVNITEAWTYHERDSAGQLTGRSRDYPRTVRPCYACNGAGEFQPLDVPAIIAAIKGRKGLCSKRPADKRAYYVWRMARTIRMQQKRESKVTDWRACVPLSDGEGY